MQPAAILSVLVSAEGVGPTNAKLNSVQSTLRKTAVAGDTAGSSVARAGAKMEKAGAGITRFGKAATKYYATPLLAAAGAALYFGQKYEKAMLMVQTHTDTNRRDLALYKREILEMGSSGKYTQGPAELGEAMYHIASDGYKGVEATTMLRKSADLAMVGQSNLAESTYALVSAMKTGIRGTETSGQAINSLNAIVGAGDMKMQELVGAMSTGILPAAKAMGLSLKDVGVAEDIMTQRGVPAQQAAYRLAMTFQMLIPHTEKAEKAFKRLGMNNMSMIKAMEANPKEGLLSALELLKKHLDEVDGHKGVDQIQDIEEIFGGGRTSRGAITLLQNLDSVKETYGRINLLAGETPKKIREAKAAPVNKLKEAWVQVETVLTELGADLIPMVAQGISWLAHQIEVVAHWFHALPAGVQMTIIKIVALTIALALLLRFIGFLVTSFGQLLGWMAKTAAETETVATTNEALAVSYGETAAAAEASAAAQTAAIEEVAAAQKIYQAEQLAGLRVGGLSGQQSMGGLMPLAEEGAQMSMFAAPAAAGAGASAAGAAAGAEAVEAAEVAAAAGGGGIAAAMMTAMTVAIPAAIGLAGLANIFTSVVNKDFGNAGEELGGALVGGIAGFMVGGPLGAAIGAGLGSVAADAIREAHLFGTGKGPTKYQSSLGASHRHVAETRQAEKGGFAKANHYEKQLSGMKQKEIRANKSLVTSERNLRQARHGAGPDAQNVVKAELGVWKAKSRVNAKIEEQHHLEKKHGFALIGAKHKAVEAVAASKVEISALKSYEHHLLAVLKKEKESGAFKGKLSEDTKQHIETLEKIEGRYSKAKMRELKSIEEAEKYVGSKFAQGLTKMTIAQAKFGKHYQGLKRGIESNPIKMHDIEVQHALNSFTTKFQLPFQKKSHEAAEKSTKSFLGWQSAATGAMGSVGAEMNKMLSAMGAKPLAFSAHTDKQKTVKKARGGEIAIGAASGDSVPAVLEKGEYVVNREAVSKVGVHKLNELNFGKAPRFQEGGPVGNMAAAISEANAIDEKHFEYVWGGGHGGFSGPYDCSGAVSAVLHAAGLLGKPMVSGELADYGAPGKGPITIYANPVHAWMEIEGRPFGTSGSNPGGGAGWYEGMSTAGFSVRHPTGIMAEQLAKHSLNGPEGELKQIGDRGIEHVESAANKYLQAHMPGKFGGGDAGEFIAGGGGPVMAQMGRILFGHGANKIGAAGIIGNAWGESELDPGAVGTGGGGLFGFTTPPISLANLHEYAAQMHKPWEDVGLQMQFMLENGGQGMIPQVNAAGSAGESAKVFMEGWEHPGIPRLDVREAGARTALAAGWQKGGPADSKDKGKSAGIEKSIKSTLHGIAEGKHLPKFNSHLKKIGRKISKIDLPHSQMERLGDFTNEVEKFSEYASNASSMTHSIENEKTGESEVIPGVFKGMGEGDWLKGELTALINLRKQVIGSHDSILTKTLPRVMRLFHHTQKRLREAQKAIREDEQKKRELKQKIQDLEKVHGDNVRKLEKEKKSLEDDLNKAQGAKTPNKQVIDNIRAEIKSKNEAIGSDQKEATSAIKADTEKIKDVEKDVHDKKRVESASSTLLTALGERRTSLYTTASDLYGQGGEFEGTGNAFYGLEQLQGKGGSVGDIPNPPELGSVGGEIFGVQNRLREIQEELNKKSPVTPADEGETEIQQLEREAGIEAQKRYLVSQSQYKVLKDFPSVGSVASVPYAGAYAIGGMVAATVGERGKEVAVMPTGSRVVPEHDAKEAIASMGGGGKTGVNFEEFHFHEADGRVHGRVNGEEFDTEVEKVTRKQSRKSAPNTPGGRRRR
jgi:TP901 family phage tail tape measure protein